LAELQEVWKKQKFSIKTIAHEYREWHDFISVANQTKADHMIIFIIGRKGTLSRHNYMDHLEDQIERYFSSRNLMLIYPEQL
jgi:hypothetical protein